MKQRCQVRSHCGFDQYGGRGIRIYPEWTAYGTGFPAFRDWIEANLGPRPEKHTLDRIDNDGHYEPGNLRWASLKEQCSNRRTDHNKSRLKHGLRWILPQRGGKWISTFSANGRACYFGTFPTKKEAHEASRAKRIEMGLPVD